MVCRSFSTRKIILILLLSLNCSALSSVGKGLLTFTLFNFEIYELELKSLKKVSSLEELKSQKEYELVFTFKRDIDKKYLKKAWTEASEKLGDKNLVQYFNQLEKLQPSMKEGEVIKIVSNDNVVHFKFPGKFAEFDSRELRLSLPWIWLGDNEVGEKLSEQIFK